MTSTRISQGSPGGPHRPPATRSLLAAATFSALALGSPSARAGSPAIPLCDDDPPCRSHRNGAMRLYEGKQYREALAEFEAAYALRPEPRLLLNIGRSLFRIGRPRSALIRYDEYKRAVPDPEPEARESIERYIKEARATVGTFSDSETEHPPVPPPPPGQAAPPSVLRPLLPPLLVMGGGVLFLLAGIGTGAGSASVGGQFDAASKSALMWTPEVAGLYSTGRALNGATAGLVVVGIVITAGGGIWLGTKLHHSEAAPKVPAEEAPK